jgi:hypothetical protein
MGTSQRLPKNADRSTRHPGRLGIRKDARTPQYLRSGSPVWLGKSSGASSRVRSAHTVTRVSAPRRPALAAAALLLTLAGCGSPVEGTGQGSAPPAPSGASSGPDPTSSAATPSSAGPSPTAAGPAASSPAASSPATPSPRATPRPPATPRPRAAGDFDVAAVLADVRRLASDIGPRLATSKRFAEAADLVDERFDRLGYRVRRTDIRVPAGDSWGVPVRAGTSQNVIAEPAGFDARRPHVVIGAHLDTVAVAPGAEDNASGVAVMLELARMVAAERPRVPVQFIAFGAEEPRGPADDEHHFGSQQYVAELSRTEREAVVGMVALDRVGVRASYVPICRSPIGGRDLRDDLRAAARRVDVASRACELTTSDHWSYAKAGMPAARLGSVPYDGYHTRRDTYGVVDRRQLDRVGTVMWSWLQGL